MSRWSCPSCTYDNKESRQKCKMCKIQKPTKDKIHKELKKKSFEEEEGGGGGGKTQSYNYYGDNTFVIKEEGISEGISRIKEEGISSGIKEKKSFVESIRSKTKKNTDWDCKHCTYTNNKNMKYCEQCGNIKKSFPRKESIVSKIHNISKKRSPEKIVYQHHKQKNVLIFGYENGGGEYYMQKSIEVPFGPYIVEEDDIMLDILKEINEEKIKQFEKYTQKATENRVQRAEYNKMAEKELSTMIDLENLGIWTMEIQMAIVYIPRDAQRRQPPVTATITEDKTFINLSFHDWLFFGEDPVENYTLNKRPYIKILISNGIEDTKGNNIDIYPITHEITSLRYQIHNLDSNPASYSPDTGLIVIDDKFGIDDKIGIDNKANIKLIYGKFICVDQETKRILLLNLEIYRDNIQEYEEKEKNLEEQEDAEITELENKLKALNKKGGTRKIRRRINSRKIRKYN